MEKQMLGKSHFYEGDVVEITHEMDSSRIGECGVVKEDGACWLSVINGYKAFFRIDDPNHTYFADKCLKLITPADGTPATWEERFTHAPQVAENPQIAKVSFVQRVEIAKAAMQGILAADTDSTVWFNPKTVASKAMEYTDALISELEKTEDTLN